jgi:FMN phosphatase YigB (HAD superfamily)
MTTETKTEYLDFPIIKHVYFDVGNVLLTFHNGLEKLAELLELPLPLVKSVWADSEVNLCSGKLPPQELWTALKGKSHYRGTDIDFPNFWVENCQPIVSTHNLVAQLTSHNTSVGIFSNLYLGIFEELVAQGKVPNINYHPKVISCEVGLVKPDRQIFELATERTKLQPREILLLDDSPQVIASALDHGWQTVIYNQSDSDRLIEELEKNLK